MKRISSLFFCLCLLLTSCASSGIKNSEAVIEKYNAALVSDRKTAAEFWSKAVFKSDDVEAVINSHLRKMGTNFAQAKFTILGSKSYKTWVFSGTIFKDVVEVDVAVMVPPPAAQKSDLVAMQPKALRQLSYLAEFEGKYEIIQSEIREVK